MAEDNWVHIHTAMGDPEASVIQSLLESEGIEVKVARESIGRLYSLSVDGLGEVKIYVLEKDAEVAKELIGFREEEK